MNQRVLFLADGLANGGAERQLALLIKYLSREWDRRVITFADGPFVQVIRADGVGVDVCARKFQFDPSPALAVWRSVVEWRPQIVHTWGWMSALAVEPISRLLHIPIVDSSIRMGMRPYRRSGAQQFAMMWATRVIANSQAGLDAWCIAPGRGRVIYNGFDPARLNLCRAINQFDARAFTIAMTGRMSLEKNFTMLIDAARVLEHSAHAGWRFVLIGDGPDRARHIYAARDLIARGMVLFPEPCLEVIRVLNDANVGVLLSHPTLHAEGISNSIMEYMACGLPVVCSDSGGNRELVLDGETGFIIPPRDVNALVEKLTWLKDHPAQAAQMGQAGRERIRAHFSVEQMVEKTIAVYREVL